MPGSSYIVTAFLSLTFKRNYFLPVLTLQTRAEGKSVDSSNFRGKHSHSEQERTSLRSASHARSKRPGHPSASAGTSLEGAPVSDPVRSLRWAGGGASARHPPPPPPRGGARGSYVSTLARQQAGDVLACACSAPFLLSGFVGLSGAGLCGHPSLSCSVNWERLWPGRGLWTWAQRCSGLPNVPHLEWQVKIKRKGKEARNRSCLRDGKRVSWAER